MDKPVTITRSHRYPLEFIKVHKWKQVTFIFCFFPILELLHSQTVFVLLVLIPSLNLLLTPTPSLILLYHSPFGIAYLKMFHRFHMKLSVCISLYLAISETNLVRKKKVWVYPSFKFYSVFAFCRSIDVVVLQKFLVIVLVSKLKGKWPSYLNEKRLIHHFHFLSLHLSLMTTFVRTSLTHFVQFIIKW